MVRRFVLLPVLVFGFILAAGAQDPKDSKDTKDPEKKADAPKSTVIKAPEGWKFVKAKDGSYAFLVPKDVKSENTSEGNVKTTGFYGKTSTYVAETASGLSFIVVQTGLNGPALKDMKIGDMYDLLYDQDKMEKGVKISEPKDITIRSLKGKEYFVTDKQSCIRKVNVVIKGRAVQMLAVGDKKDKVVTKECDTFLSSLILYAPKKDPAKDGEKKDAPKDAEKKDAPKDKGSDK